MIFVSENAHENLISYLKSLDEITIIHGTDLVYSEVSSHPDIYMCDLKDKVIHAENDELGFKYPENCAFNAACTGKYFIHNLKITSKRLLKEAEGMQHIDVPQGYTKCNVLTIDEESIITSDRGIYEKCKDSLNTLLITESTKETPHVLLKGFPYGFIGGATGRVKDEIIFNGKISDHPDYEKIKEFIESRGLKIKEFDHPLEDIGSIIHE